MILQRLTFAQLETVYREQLYYDFPDNERRSLQNMTEYIQQGLYEAWGLFDGSLCLAYSCFMGDQTRKILDYFAVNKLHRGRGIGSYFLSQCLAQYPNVLILVEAEKADGIDPLKTKRIQFYTRNGLLDTAVYIRLFDVDYVILANHPVDQAEIFKVYQSFYNPSILKKHFCILKKEL